MSAIENKSQVARLLHRIDMEYQAAQWGLTGLAEGTAKHAYITRRLENIGAYQEQLAQLVGTGQAAQLLCETMEHSSQEAAQ